MAQRRLLESIVPWIDENKYLSESEMKNNAILINGFFKNEGWTPNAIAAMLGNMQGESTINPGRKEIVPSGWTEKNGFGLVGWTPATVLINWASGNGLDYRDGYTQCRKIQDEMLHRGFYPNYNVTPSVSPITFKEFSISTEPVNYLAEIFLKYYEQPRDVNQPNRIKWALEWYTFITGDIPEIKPDEPMGNLPDIIPELQGDGITPLVKYGAIYNINRRNKKCNSMKLLRF